MGFCLFGFFVVVVVGFGVVWFLWKYIQFFHYLWLCDFCPLSHGCKTNICDEPFPFQVREAQILYLCPLFLKIPPLLPHQPISRRDQRENKQTRNDFASHLPPASLFLCREHGTEAGTRVCSCCLEGNCIVNCLCLGGLTQQQRCGDAVHTLPFSQLFSPRALLPRCDVSLT